MSEDAPNLESVVTFCIQGWGRGDRTDVINKLRRLRPVLAAYVGAAMVMEFCTLYDGVELESVLQSFMSSIHDSESQHA